MLTAEIKTQILKDINDGKVPTQFAGSYSTKDILDIFKHGFMVMEAPAEASWDEEFKSSQNDIIVSDYVQKYYLPKKEVSNTETNNIAWETYFNDEPSLSSID